MTAGSCGLAAVARCNVGKRFVLASGGERLRGEDRPLGED